ncbi:MAG: fatty acid--CoA ligase family protein [Neomegalonema sp.]|nr:fatty acid--CoA ligase family protein [Neomegalonema sp.]
MTASKHGGALLLEGRNDTALARAVLHLIEAHRPSGIIRAQTARQLELAPASAIGAQKGWRLPCAGLEGQKLLCFTSGSTGQPKAILRSWESWLVSFAVQRQMLAYPQTARPLICGDMSHSMHLFGAMEALVRGVEPVVLAGFTPKAAIEALRDPDLTMLYATPTQLEMLLRAAAKERFDQLAYILCGGAKLDPVRAASVRACFPGARLIEFYGASETSFIAMKTPDAPPGSVGPPCPGVEIEILDPDGMPVPQGAQGEIWVRSAMLFERYALGEDPNTIWQGGFLSIGDIGWRDGDGYLFVEGRKSGMVTIAGENVFIDPLEQFLASALPGRQICVLRLPDPLRENRLVAVTDRALEDEERRRVMAELRARWGSLAVPHAVHVVSPWPMLPSGKPDRQALGATLV